MCDLSYEETSSLWFRECVRARKPHRCACCGSAVAAGGSYVRTKSLYDGCWQQWAECLPCSKRIDAFGKEHRLTPSADTFSEYLDQCVDERGPGFERWQRVRNWLSRRRAVVREKAGAA